MPPDGNYRFSQNNDYRTALTFGSVVRIAYICIDIPKVISYFPC